MRQRATSVTGALLCRVGSSRSSNSSTVCSGYKAAATTPALTMAMSRMGVVHQSCRPCRRLGSSMPCLINESIRRTNTTADSQSNHRLRLLPLPLQQRHHPLGTTQSMRTTRQRRVVWNGGAINTHTATAHPVGKTSSDRFLYSNSSVRHYTATSLERAVASAGGGDSVRPGDDERASLASAPQQHRPARSTTTNAQLYLDDSLFPIGSWTPSVVDTVMATLDNFKKVHPNSSSTANHNSNSHNTTQMIETINLSMSLLKRLVQELAHHLNQDPSLAVRPSRPSLTASAVSSSSNALSHYQHRAQWVGNARYFNPIFHQWKHVALSLVDKSQPSPTTGQQAIVDPNVATAATTRVLPATTTRIRARTVASPPPPVYNTSTTTTVMRTDSETATSGAAPASRKSSVGSSLSSSGASSTWSTATLPSAKDVVKLLQTLSTLLPNGLFRYDISTIGIIMRVIIQQAPPQKAPLVAEKLLAFVQDEAAAAMGTAAATPSAPSLLAPTVRTYTLILSAWAESGLPQAPIRMTQLLREMKDQNIVPNIVTYNILLRFWANRGNIEQVQQIVQTVEAAHKEATAAADCEPATRQHVVKLDVLSLAQVIFCYTQVGQMNRACQVLFDQMIPLRKSGRQLDTKAVAESVQNIMMAYRNAVASAASSNEHKKQVVADAEALLARIKEADVLAQVSLERVENTLMDVYTRAGMIDQVEAMFASTRHPDVVRCGVLIKAYGNCDRADNSSSVLLRALDNPAVTPNVDIFTSLIDAWAESSRPDAVEQALGVLKLMEEHERCIALGLRPCVVTFSALLKCISEAKPTTALPAESSCANLCELAESILDTMEMRYQNGETNARPNQISYTLAMKACFRAGDLTKADAIMKRMEKSDTPPDIRTYSDILLHYSLMATPAAAERTEQILAYMTELSRTTPAVRPNIYSYSIVLNAWAVSGDPKAAERMWGIYQQTKREGVAMDLVFSTALITFLCRLKRRKAMQRALEILYEMEQSLRMDHRPGVRQYKIVMQGFIAAGDAANATLVLLRFVEAHANGQTRAILGSMDMDGYRDEDDDGMLGGNAVRVGDNTLDGASNNRACAYPRPAMFHDITVAWIRQGDLVKATRLLDKMSELYESHQVPVGPDLGTYNLLLRNWSGSSHPLKHQYIAQIEAHISQQHEKQLRRKSRIAHLSVGR